MEQFIARCVNSQDPLKLVDALEKIRHIDVPLEELEVHRLDYIMNPSIYTLD